MTADTSDLPCLVVDCTEVDRWPNRFGEPAAGLVPRPRRIPAGKAPTILQPTREMAEGEAKRLAREHIGRRFVVFQAVAVGTRVEIPTHINLRGETLARRLEPVVLQLGDAPDEIPF